MQRIQIAWAISAFVATRALTQRQRDDELAAKSASGAGRCDVSAMSLDQGANHCKPDTHANAVESGGVGVLHKGLENPG